MNSFIAAIFVAFLLAAGASVVLNENQRTVAEAYATQGVRL
jgi:hypothetical protein